MVNGATSVPSAGKPFTRAVREAQGEGGVGRDRPPVDLPARLGDLLHRAGGRRVHLVLEEPARLAGQGIEAPRQDDHRVGRGGDRRRAAVEERLARRGVLRASCRRPPPLPPPPASYPPSAAFTNAWSGPSLSTAELAAGRSRVDRLEVRVDRGRREQLVPERVEVRVHVLLVALLVRLLHLGDVLHDLAGDPQQPRAAEADEPRVHRPRRRASAGCADTVAQGSPIDWARAGSAADLRAQGLLLLGLRRHRLRVEERRVVAPEGLLRVLVAEDLRRGPAASAPRRGPRTRAGRPAGAGTSPGGTAGPCRAGTRGGPSSRAARSSRGARRRTRGRRRPRPSPSSAGSDAGFTGLPPS